MSGPRVAFVYPNPRGHQLEQIAAGLAPDTTLLGANHLTGLGVDAFSYDSVLRRTTPGNPILHRLSWHARELVLPWELRRADLIATPLANLLPLASRAWSQPRVLLLSYHLGAAFGRAGTARRTLLRASLRSAVGIVAASQAARELLLERAGLPERHVRVAELGVDAAWWQPTPLPGEGIVLSVGRDLARDYQTLAHAVAGLDARVVLVAKEENLHGVSLPPNVEVRLNIGPLEVRDLYAEARCVVVPVHPAGDSRGTENSGTIALLEAMAAGRPVIATDRPFLRDYVSEQSATLVPAGGVEELRTAISRLLTDDALANERTRAARAAVEMRFSTVHAAERLARAITELPWS
jgi:glycosyltransferase involved in cell wall biosynthesis